ncbi:MAG: hypothetical protein OHK0029_09950 [Armatimonadaceae bacterium]
MSTTTPRTAYEILGVPKTASTDEIKRKYRQLARQYHPDVNQGNPSAAQTFAQMTEAYKTLSDPEKRTTYDAELSLQERQAEKARARQWQSAGSSYAGYNTRNPNVASNPPRSAGTQTPPPRAGTNQAAEVARLVAEARNAFQRGKFLEARSRAEQVVRITARNAEAYEILGDVFRIQGKNDQAMNMYSMALQINPRNYSVMQRLERVARSSGMASSPGADRIFFSNRDEPRQSYTPPPRYTPPPSSYSGGYAGSGAAGDEKQGIGKLLMGFFGYAGVLLMILYVMLFPGEAPRGGALIPLVSTWNSTLLTVLISSGALLGATMTITGTIRRIDDELILGSTGGRFAVPVGLIMIVVSVFSFYLAAVGYAVYAATQEAFTRTIQWAFGAVLLVTLILGAVYTPGHIQVLLWGGNVVFLSFVIGWLLGDFFRND